MSKLSAIKAQSLSKTYTRRVKQPGLLGALVGLIGENGAGKSTTVKMLTGILRPSGGQLEVLGRKPWREREQLARQIGVVFGQKPQLLWDIAVRETFSLLKEMYGVPDALFQETSRKAIDLLDLEPLLDIPVRQLSLGQRMRCDLAAACLHAPRIAFLDEPTIGLDVVAKEQARELIRYLNKRHGSTILLTTHDIKDITETCQRVILLDKGGLLFDGSLKRFEAKFASERRLIADLGKGLSPARQAGLKKAVSKAGGRALKITSHRVEIAYTQKTALIRLNKLLLSQCDVADLNLERAEIDEVVRRIYDRKARA